MRFIYVMGKTDRDTLIALGYELLKADEVQQLYIFENKAELTFGLGDIKFILSDTLTF